jgi:hypothetical protein
VANTILLKRSGTAGKVPLTANLTIGELSINYTDGRLYTTNGSNIIDLSQNDKLTASGDVTGTSTNPAVGYGYSNIALTLSSTGVTAGNYGSATSIPTIVVDAKGRITSITTNAVSTTFSLAAGSGSGSVSGGGTLTVSGGTGITTSVSGSTYTITNSGVTSLAGTTGQITASGSTGAITLSLPSTLNLSTVQASTIGNSGATLTGTLSTASQPNITTLAGVTSLGTAGATTTATGNFTVSGNLTVNGTYEYVNSTVTTHEDPILELNTGPNGAALTGTAFDAGIKTHYWTGVADATSFFGRTTDAGSFEYYGIVSGESGNVISGTYGTIKGGAVIVANSTSSSSTTTGALQVSGGAGIAGAVYAGSLYDNGNRTLTTASSLSNSGGDASVSGAYNALVLTLNTVNTNTGTFGNATYLPTFTVNGKGLLTAAGTALVTPAWSSITGTPTTLSGYGITDALSTSATIDGGTF